MRVQQLVKRPTLQQMASPSGRRSFGSQVRNQDLLQELSHYVLVSCLSWASMTLAKAPTASYCGTPSAASTLPTPAYAGSCSQRPTQHQIKPQHKAWTNAFSLRLRACMLKPCKLSGWSIPNTAHKSNIHGEKHATSVSKLSCRFASDCGHQTGTKMIGGSKSRPS